MFGVNWENNLIICKKHYFSYNDYCTHFHQALTWYTWLLIISSISEMEHFGFFGFGLGFLFRFGLGFFWFWFCFLFSFVWFVFWGVFFWLCFCFCGVLSLLLLLLFGVFFKNLWDLKWPKIVKLVHSGYGNDFNLPFGVAEAWSAVPFLVKWCHFMSLLTAAPILQHNQKYTKQFGNQGQSHLFRFCYEFKTKENFQSAGQNSAGLKLSNP